MYKKEKPVERHLAVESEFRQALGEIITRLWSLEDATLLNIVTVSVTKDLASAIIVYSFWPRDHAQEKTRVLHHLTKEIRKELSHRVRLRRIPKLIWKYDRAADKVDEIYAFLDRIKEDGN